MDKTIATQQSNIHTLHQVGHLTNHASKKSFGKKLPTTTKNSHMVHKRASNMQLDLKRNAKSVIQNVAGVRSPIEKTTHDYAEKIYQKRRNKELEAERLAEEKAEREKQLELENLARAKQKFKEQQDAIKEQNRKNGTDSLGEISPDIMKQLFKKRQGKTMTQEDLEDVQQKFSDDNLLGSGSEDDDDEDDEETTYGLEEIEALPVVNQKTHMVYKEINKIENMEKFVSLKSLWIRFRNIKKIQNLENQYLIENLDLRSNQIRVIENLSHMTYLQTLNIQGNQIKIVSGLKGLQYLENLDLSSNLIQYTYNCQELLDLPRLKKLDMKNNLLEDTEEIIPFFSELKGLQTLCLKGNPFIIFMSMYRDKVISEMSNLFFFDDYPIKQIQRINAMTSMSQLSQKRNTPKHRLNQQILTQDSTQVKLRQFDEPSSFGLSTLQFQTAALATTTNGTISIKKNSRMTNSIDWDLPALSQTNKNIIFGIQSKSALDDQKYSSVNQSPSRMPNLQRLNEQSHLQSKNQIVDDSGSYLPSMKLPQFIHRKNLLKSDRESQNTEARTGGLKDYSKEDQSSKIRAFAHSIDFQEEIVDANSQLNSFSYDNSAMVNTNVELKKIFNKQKRNQKQQFLGSDYGAGAESPQKMYKETLIERLVLDSSSRDSTNGGIQGYYNYQQGHKYALGTVNTELRNKLSNTEMNVYQLEVNRLMKNKKQQSFRVVNGMLKPKKPKGNHQHMRFSSMQMPNSHNQNVFEWSDETEELLSQILVHVQFDFEQAQSQFVNLTQSFDCSNLEILDLREKWTEIDYQRQQQISYLNSELSRQAATNDTMLNTQHDFNEPSIEQ